MESILKVESLKKYYGKNKKEEFWSIYTLQYPLFQFNNFILYDSLLICLTEEVY